MERNSKAASVGGLFHSFAVCRVHETPRTTPAAALGIAERDWPIGDLLDAVLPPEPNRPVRVTRNFTVIDGGKAVMAPVASQLELPGPAKAEPFFFTPKKRPQRRGNAEAVSKCCPS